MSTEDLGHIWAKDIMKWRFQTWKHVWVDRHLKISTLDRKDISVCRPRTWSTSRTERHGRMSTSDTWKHVWTAMPVEISNSDLKTVLSWTTFWNFNFKHAFFLSSWKTYYVLASDLKSLLSWNVSMFPNIKSSAYIQNFLHFVSHGLQYRLADALAVFPNMWIHLLFAPMLSCITIFPFSVRVQQSLSV